MTLDRRHRSIRRSGDCIATAIITTLTKRSNSELGAETIGKRSRPQSPIWTPRWEKITSNVSSSLTEDRTEVITASFLSRCVRRVKYLKVLRAAGNSNIQATTQQLLHFQRSIPKQNACSSLPYSSWHPASQEESCARYWKSQ